MDARTDSLKYKKLTQQGVTTITNQIDVSDARVQDSLFRESRTLKYYNLTQGVTSCLNFLGQ